MRRWASIGAVAALSIGLCTVGPACAGSTTYTYDALGRVLTVTTSDGTTIVYSYDAAGNRTQVATNCSAATWGCVKWGSAHWGAPS